MDKIAVGPEAAGVIDLNAPVEENLTNIARAKGKSVNTLTVVILNRPRHRDLIAKVRGMGGQNQTHQRRRCGWRLDVRPAGNRHGCADGHRRYARGRHYSLRLKMHGQAIISAVSGREMKKNASAVLSEGLDLEKVHGITDLVSGDNIFFAATGVTGGEFLEGVQFIGSRTMTHSMVLRSQTGTLRRIEAVHLPEKIRDISRVVDQPEF